MSSRIDSNYAHLDAQAFGLCKQLGGQKIKLMVFVLDSQCAIESMMPAGWNT